MKLIFTSLSLIFFLSIPGYSQQNKTINVIPCPDAVNLKPGTFMISASTGLDVAQNLISEAGFLNLFIQNGIGTKLQFSRKKNNTISLLINKSLQPEAYKLEISKNLVRLSGGSPAGVFSGIQTLRQLLSKKIEVPGSSSANLSLPCLDIEDSPAFDYRGMHLDVSRHFFSIDFLKKYVDLLALYKFNRLHLHLSDDQGWRIEIKKYPKLAQNGGWRNFNNQDSACIAKSKDNPDMALDPRFVRENDGQQQYGGYYTQKQMIDFVKYASSRHIEIIPEIDMPGHMMAAIKSYPFLSCTGDSQWGKLFTTPICPCKESTYEFAQNLFKEIFAIFPSKYIHIGGDEVDRTSWETSGLCEELMKKEGIKNSAGLQSYFINRMEKFFNANGKRLIGWDEILEEGISSTAMVMYWRTWVPGAPLKALKNGNQVIMTPGEPLYFDYPPNKNSLHDVYNFSIVPAGYPSKDRKNIIGAQANLWSEMVPSEKRAEYMAFPRAIALAENLWSHEHRDFSSFSSRLLAHYPRLDLMGVNYRLPDLENVITERVFVDQDTLFYQKPLDNMILRFTQDGSRPSVKSPALDKPIIIKENRNIKLGVFAKADTNLRSLYQVNFKKQTLTKALHSPITGPGLSASYFKRLTKYPIEEGKLKPDSLFYTSSISVPSSVDAPVFRIDYIGMIEVPKDGIYTFYLNCDDSGVLSIGDKPVVDNGGMHSAIEKNGQIALQKGTHPFNLVFLEGGGGFKLKLLYSFMNSVPAEVPSSWFKH